MTSAGARICVEGFSDGSETGDSLVDKIGGETPAFQ